MIEAKSLMRLTPAFRPFIISDAWCLLRVPQWLRVRNTSFILLFTVFTVPV
jgi:hypothetical protein